VLTPKGESPLQRSNWQAVSDNKGLVYLWGGCSETWNYTCTFQNTSMFIFDTIQNFWTTQLPLTHPMSQSYYTATLLPDNGTIIYIGGTTTALTFTPIDINQVKGNIF